MAVTKVIDHETLTIFDSKFSLNCLRMNFTFKYPFILKTSLDGTQTLRIHHPSDQFICTTEKMSKHTTASTDASLPTTPAPSSLSVQHRNDHDTKQDPASNEKTLLLLIPNNNNHAGCWCSTPSFRNTHSSPLDTSQFPTFQQEDGIIIRNTAGNFNKPNCSTNSSTVETNNFETICKSTHISVTEMNEPNSKSNTSFRTHSLSATPISSTTTTFHDELNFCKNSSLSCILGLLIIISSSILLMILAISITILPLLNLYSPHSNANHSPSSFSSSLTAWISNIWLHSILPDPIRSGLNGMFNSVNTTRENNKIYTDNSTFYTLDEKFTHCRVFPQMGQGRAILQWKFLEEPSFSDYKPLNNNSDNYLKGPIIRMRLVIGETPSNIYIYPKLFGFAKNLTSPELKKFLKKELDELGNLYQYFFNQDLDNKSSIKMIDFLNQPLTTLHATYMDALPTLYISRNNLTQQAYLKGVTGTIITENIIPNYLSNNTNVTYPDAICNDGDDVALLPLFKRTRLVSYRNTTKKAQSFCSYSYSFIQTGGCYTTFEKRWNRILSKSANTTERQNNDDEDVSSSLKYVVYFIGHNSANFANTTSQSEQAKFLASSITSQNPEVFYLVHEVDFSIDYYDKNCDYYISLYSMSPMEIYNYWRVIRHVCIFLYSMVVAGFLLLYKNKQPIKSRILISGLSVVACLIFSILGCIGDFNFFNYDGIEYSFYITLAVLYLISMCRYLFVRNLYRVVKIVDGLEDVRFNDEKKVRHFKKRLDQLYALSKLASVRFFGAVMVILIILFNIPTPVFVWILNDRSTVSDDIKNIFSTAIVYLKMVSLVVGFILPGFCTIFIDLAINRKWIFNPILEFFKRSLKIERTSDKNSAQSQYMKQVQASTKTFISPTSGITRYFSSYDDPLAYRLEFMTSTIIALILGFSTFGVGLIQIPNWRVVPKITLLSVHGTLYLLFEMSYVLLTCGFIVIVQLVAERKKANTKKLFFASDLARTRDASTKLLMDTIADVTGDGRSLIYRVSFLKDE